MAGDHDFNRKSFTTGHTGFGIPFTTFPDRSDVPRSAARPMRYLDRYVTTRQGEVFYTTEVLARLEGLERGPAGNIALAAAFAIAREMDDDQTIVVQETEYTGAGKHVQPQLAFARSNGIEIRFGDPREEIPGTSIVLPADPSMISTKPIALQDLKRSYIRNAVAFAKTLGGRAGSAGETAGETDPLRFDPEDMDFLAEETRSTVAEVEAMLGELKLKE